jgi:hypothetical protein
MSSVFSTLPGSRETRHRSLVLEDQNATREHIERLNAKDRDLEHIRLDWHQRQRRADEVAAVLNRGQAERRMWCLDFDRQREEREREILAHADPRLDAFKDELKTIQSRLRVTRRSVVTIDSTGQRRAGEASNLEAIRVVSDAICAARERAEAMKLESIDDVDAALDELRRTIPTLDEAEASLNDLPEAS